MKVREDKLLESWQEKEKDILGQKVVALVQKVVNEVAKWAVID